MKSFLVTFLRASTFFLIGYLISHVLVIWSVFNSQLQSSSMAMDSKVLLTVRSLNSPLSGMSICSPIIQVASLLLSHRHIQQTMAHTQCIKLNLSVISHKESESYFFGKANLDTMLISCTPLNDLATFAWSYVFPLILSDLAWERHSLGSFTIL